MKEIKNKFQLDEEDYTILRNILLKYPYKFYVYGSRTKGRAKKYSDMDLFCRENMEEKDLFNIKDQIEESDITIKVDILLKKRCSETFMRYIEDDLIEFT